MGLDELLNNINTLAIVCNQWGDTGKGKFVDYFAEWADIIARGTGGANAGHTLWLNGIEYIFHLIPSGIVHDKDGKINILGKGMAFDPRIVMEEMDFLDKNNLSYDHLKVSRDAKLVLPSHLVMDRMREASTGEVQIGTTGRGIGPCYTDHVGRIGLTVMDMLNPDLFRNKLEKNLKDKVRLLNYFDKEKVKEVMNHEHLRNGIYYHPKKIFDTDAIINDYMEFGKYFKPFISNTDSFLQQNVGKKKILLEGAQGGLLGVDDGTYPFVTSSDPTVAGLAKGVGLNRKDIDLVLGIVKAFYMTRVGRGPFPTEIGGAASEKHCNEYTLEREQEEFTDVSVNDLDEMRQGVAIRYKGKEYGATTRRPRRTGWLDLPLLRYATANNKNGKQVILTKVDVLDKCETIKICTSYEYKGPEQDLGDRVLKNGDILNVAIPRADILQHCKPRYDKLPGWCSDITHCTLNDQLPFNTRDIVEYVAKEADVNIRAISVGPERDQTIVL